jgi:hypothetical protein
MGEERTDQAMYYSGSNMSGQSAERTPTKPAWSYDAPGTFGEAETQVACGLTGVVPLSPRHYRKPAR